ncbi:MAG: glycosyltransferase family 2 protein [Candidatus Melainabacteria bacterium]|nr:glycosyltransferase family 2 protein [Candidatus Melainabacteria bacterium]
MIGDSIIIDKPNLKNESLVSFDKSPSEKTLTIIIPAFNESGRILETLESIDEYITKKSKSDLFYVIVVNDGSSDDTKEVVISWIGKCKNKKSFDLINYLPNRGKGHAVKEGFSKANTDLVMYTDADSASPIEEVEKLLDCIDNGYDVVCGSRILKSEKTKVIMGFKRRLVGLVFHFILRFLGLANLKDTQCGFKLFKIQLAKKLISNQKCFNYSFDVEYLFLSKKFGYKIQEVSINWHHVEGSKVSLIRDSVKMLLEVLKIRFVYKYN